MKMFQTIANRRMRLIILIISVSYALFLLSPVLMTIPKAPKGAVNMMVGHYFEDYYEYLSFLRQGEKPGITLQNLFTTGDTKLLTIPWWPYRIIGIIGFVLAGKWNFVYYYWLASFILIILLVMLQYILITELLARYPRLLVIGALFLSMFSSNFFRITEGKGWNAEYFDFWYSAGNPFARYNIGTLHHQLAQIFFLSGILVLIRYLYSKRQLAVCAVFLAISFLLFSTAPPLFVLLWAAVYSALITDVAIRIRIFRKEKIRQALSGKLTDDDRMFLTTAGGLVFAAMIFLPVVLIITRAVSASPVQVIGKIWDLQHFLYPSVKDFMLSYGPVAVLGTAGTIFYVRKMDFPKAVVFYTALYSILIALVPVQFGNKNVLSILGVHNLRFQTPVTVVFFAVSGVMFLGGVLKSKIFAVSIICFCMALCLPSIYIHWLELMGLPYRASFLQYMPNELYADIRVLSYAPEGNILTSPKSYLGLAVPAIAGRKVYYGRSIFTPQIEDKGQHASDFYALKMKPQDAESFLHRERIRYILMLQMDGDPAVLLKTYPFLRKETTAGGLTMLSYEEK